MSILPMFSVKKLFKFFSKIDQARPEWMPRRRDIFNGAVVNQHFERPIGRFRTYDAVDGTIRVSRIGQPFKVAPKKG